MALLSGPFITWSNVCLSFIYLLFSRRTILTPSGCISTLSTWMVGIIHTLFYDFILSNIKASLITMRIKPFLSSCPLFIIKNA